MHIDIDDLARLMSGQIRTLPVGRIPDEVVQHLNSSTSTVFLSTASIRHILQQHGDHLEVPELCLIPTAIDRGLWIPDRPFACCVSYFNEPSGLRYIASVKVTRRRHELYLSTFHRSAKRQTKALLKRGEPLRNHL